MLEKLVGVEEAYLKRKYHLKNKKKIKAKKRYLYNKRNGICVEPGCKRVLTPSEIKAGLSRCKICRDKRRTK